MSKECTILVSDADNGEGYTCMGLGGIWGIAVPPSQFIFKPKNAVKNKGFKKAKKKNTDTISLHRKE